VAAGPPDAGRAQVPDCGGEGGVLEPAHLRSADAAETRERQQPGPLTCIAAQARPGCAARVRHRPGLPQRIAHSPQPRRTPGSNPDPQRPRPRRVSRLRV
jgi:hypothetical protein